jgi:predicted nucleic acid-binding protein
LLDTGAIVALLDRSEQYHSRSTTAVQQLKKPLVTCEAVIAEACFLLRSVEGASEAVVENVEKGIFQTPFSLARSSARVRRVLRKYKDMRIDLADACLICLAEDLKTGEILTLDSDFRFYRWDRKRPFQLLIELD